MGWLLLAGGVAVLWLVSTGGGGEPPDTGQIGDGMPADLVPFMRTSTGWENTPPPELWDALSRTARLYREWFEAIAVFTSAYRSAVVNGAVGSELGISSAHVWGRALDLVERPGISRGVLRAQCMAAKLSGAIRSWVDEGDHIHVEW